MIPPDELSPSPAPEDETPSSSGPLTLEELTDQIEQGTLYLVSTPIGHRGDLSPRALAVIRGADIVAAEDTRHTGSLLASLKASRPLKSYHEHNKTKAAIQLVEELEAGLSVALVTDAGTPGLSDPGYVLVRAAVLAGIPVVAVPGPSAVLSALVISGLPTDAFTFTGFLPPKKGRRRTALTSLSELPHTLVFYESPHRIAAALADMQEVFGDRWTAVCRELTKKYEEVRRGRLSDLAHFYETSRARGEFTIVVAGAGFKGTLLS
ncbi:16S rRNA (cytidine(1402)-2'-O)-methyltransferase [Gemmatimonadota bacterium]